MASSGPQPCPLGPRPRGKATSHQTWSTEAPSGLRSGFPRLCPGGKEGAQAIGFSPVPSPQASLQIGSDGSAGKESARNAGDAGEACSIPGLGRSPGEGHGNPFKHSFLENPKDIYLLLYNKLPPKLLALSLSRKTIQYHSNPSLCPNH